MGGKNGHQHLQLFLVIAHDCTKSVAKMNKLITETLKEMLVTAFGDAYVDGIKISCKRHTLEKSTYHFLIGYTLKDRKKAHFRWIGWRVGPLDIEKALDDFLEHGFNTDMKGKQVLSIHNFWQIVSNFLQVLPVEGDVTDPVNVVMCILRSNRVYTTGDVFMRLTNRHDVVTAEDMKIVLRIMSDPESCQYEDVYRMMHGPMPIHDCCQFDRGSFNIPVRGITYPPTGTPPPVNPSEGYPLNTGFELRSFVFQGRAGEMQLIFHFWKKWSHNDNNGPLNDTFFTPRVRPNAVCHGTLSRGQGTTHLQSRGGYEEVRCSSARHRHFRRSTVH